MDKFFKNIKAAVGSAWEETLLQNSHRVSTPLAKRMLSQMGLGEGTRTPFRLFENACGAGVVAPILQQLITPGVLKHSSILCGDYSEQLLELTQKRIEVEGWVNTEAKVIDAQKTGLADGTFTHVLVNIGFHVVPDSEAALDEAIRVLEPGGSLGFTTWHRDCGWMLDVKEAFQSFPFEAPCHLPLQTTPWGNWPEVNWVRQTLLGKGLRDVQVDVFAYLTHVESTEYFLASFGMMVDFVVNSCWSEELRAQHPREEVHQRVREFLERKYGGGDGWDYSWIALVASARVPPKAVTGG